jgi:type IV pilus assembly protein PilA
MSEQKDYLRKLIKTIVFLLAFAISGIASIGIFSFLMGAALGVGSFAIGGIATGITSIGTVGSALIPKLFVPSAKSKARELSPAAETWVKLQEVYKMETGKVGDCSQISYTLPGEGKTANFTYGCGIQRDGSVYWSAKNNEPLDECPAGSQWALLMRSGNEYPEVLLPENMACQKLTPNFSKLGKTGQEKTAEEAAKRAAEEEAAKKAAEEIEAAMKGLATDAEESIDDIMKLLEDAGGGENDAATTELEAAAKKWIKEGKIAKGGKFFTFGLGGDVYNGECGGDCYWQATSKEKIGNCPAKSEWKMGTGEDCTWSLVPKNCESITPKTITSFNKC